MARVDKNKKKEVLETLKENDKKTNIRLIIFVLAIIFVLIFLFNLLRPMLSASVKDGEVSDNIKTIDAIQTAEVKTVETAVKQIEASYEHDSSSGIRVKYRRKFADSIILGDSLTEGLVYMAGFLSQLFMLISVEAFHRVRRSSRRRLRHFLSTHSLRME